MGASYFVLLKAKLILKNIRRVCNISNVLFKHGGKIKELGNKKLMKKLYNCIK